MKVVRLSVLRTSRLYSPRRYQWYSFLLETECGRKIKSMKNHNEPPAIETATFRVVGQCLKQLRHRVPLYIYVSVSKCSCCLYATYLRNPNDVK